MGGRARCRVEGLGRRGHGCLCLLLSPRVLLGDSKGWKENCKSCATRRAERGDEGAGPAVNRLGGLDMNLRILGVLGTIYYAMSTLQLRERTKTQMKTETTSEWTLQVYLKAFLSVICLV